MPAGQNGLDDIRRQERQRQEATDVALVHAFPASNLANGRRISPYEPLDPVPRARDESDQLSGGRLHRRRRVHEDLCLNTAPPERDRCLQFDGFMVAIVALRTDAP